MKRALLYILGAVVLGVAMMIFPQWIFWISYATSGDSADYVPTDGAFTQEQSFEEALSYSPKEWHYTGVPEKPSYEQTASYGDVWILLLSFILALTVRFLYKRRAPSPPYWIPRL